MSYLKVSLALLFIMTFSSSTGDSAAKGTNTIEIAEAIQSIERAGSKSDKAEKKIKEALQELKQVSREFDTLKLKVDAAVGKFKYRDDTIKSPYLRQNEVWRIRYMWDSSFHEWIYDVNYGVKKYRY